MERSQLHVLLPTSYLLLSLMILSIVSVSAFSKPTVGNRLSSSIQLASCAKARLKKGIASLTRPGPNRLVLSS